MMRRLAMLLVLASPPAYAGRTLYGWLPETQPLPDGAFELQTSLYEHDNLGPYHERSSSLVWTPAIALTPCFELALPVELTTRTQDDAAPWSGIARYGGELRWHLPLSVPGLHVMARVALAREVAVQSELLTAAGVAGSYDLDRVQVAADLGGVLDINFAHHHEELHPGLGVSVRVTGELRLGAELHAKLSHDVTAPSWTVAGPDVAWQRRRFWLAGAFGIGLEHIMAAPRLNIGMTFQ